MTRTLLYVGETLLDLFSKSVIAVTYQLVDIRDLKIRRVSRSSTFELPATENNLLTLGMPQNVHSNSEIPYTQIAVKCFSNGIEYFKGNLKISEVQETIKTNINEATIDVFELIKGKKLYQINSINQTAWNAADIDSARTATTGVVAPVINWGDFDTGTTAINSTLYLPSYFYSTIILSILNNTGYTFTGDILTNSDFTDLIIPFSGEEFLYVYQYQDERTFSANNTIAQTLLTPSLEKITADSVTQGSAGWYETANSRFQIPDFSSSGDIGTADLYFILDVNIEHGYAPTGAEERFQIRKNGVTVLGTTSVFPSDALPTDYHLIVKAEGVTFQDSDYFEVFFFSFNEIPDVVTINSINFYGHVTRTPNRNLLFHNYLLPDIDQIDLLKDFFVRFGAFMKLENDGVTVTVMTLSEVINAKHLSKDWTEKRTRNRKDHVLFEYQSYAQSNLFKYSQGDGVEETLGQGDLPVNNENLDEEDTYFTSIFENCNTLAPDDVSVNMASIPVFDGTSVVISDFVNAPGLKLLTLREKITEEPAITFNATPRSDYKVAYFIDPSQTKDTGFQYFIDQWYSELIVSFDKTKLIDREYLLTVDDLIDPPLIVFDSGSYFLVNKIPKFIPDRVTEKVELLRIY